MRSTIIPIILAISLILVGGALFVVGFSGVDLVKKTVSVVKEIGGDFDNIFIDVTNADVSFEVAGDGKSSISYESPEGIEFSAKVENGNLLIEENDTRRWYEHISIYSIPTKITVFLPADEYGDLTADVTTGDVRVTNGLEFGNIDISITTGDVKISATVGDFIKVDSTTGDVEISNANVENIDVSTGSGRVALSDLEVEGEIKLSTNTGDVKVMKVNCKKLTSTGTTGDITLEETIATETIFIKLTTGDVHFVRSDSENIYVNCGTGDVRGSLLTKKIFLADTTTGSIDVPKTAEGGRCEIITTTGDIKITVLS